jgi:PAS domain S-box-containing protein
VEISAYTRKCLREDEEFILCRARASEAESPSVLLLIPASIRPSLESLKKIEHEYSLRDELDITWAVRPLSLLQCNGQKALVLEDPGGELLHRLIQEPMEIGQFLRIAVGLAAALRQLHKQKLIHKDVKPSNVMVDIVTGRVWLTGFGITSRLPRERQSLQPPEFIAGTLSYMAPEQTGRMNRSIDSRSDLYALGVTLYEVLTGSLPFTASDPMELVHCHIARHPVPPHARVKTVARCLSAIAMKLIAKTPEERYQTASGAESDLRRCLTEWEEHGRIADFPLGEHDVPDRLLIPEQLYGRAREMEVLLGAFERVVAGDGPRLVLVSGYSGIGKSAFVNELHKSLIPPHGLFASGKSDQYKRDIPYAPLAKAFQGLFRPLLNKTEEELGKWRDALHEALDPNGQLLVELVPELKLVIGEQPAVPKLSARDAQNRFQQVFRRFIGVFARPEHPLALFFDDLQWLDAATLDLIEDLLTQPDVKHLLLIGAYRDNEVGPAHPLMSKLEAIRRSGVKLQEIALAPLTREDMERLIADSVYCEPDQTCALAELVHEKTTGNPFFVIQFLSELADEGLLAFNHGEGRWTWDLSRIRAKDHTDNVADLVVGKLNRMPADIQSVLKQLACLGNSADFTMLKIIYRDSNEELERQLWQAVQAGLVLRSEDSYRFLHDRVQEAAYSLIPDQLRAEMHLRIGRLLVERTPSTEREERIFEIVNHFNRATHLITANDERRRVAELNLIAARRAKLSIAYASALSYLATGRALLAQDESWNTDYELIFSLEGLIAECELLTADMESAEKRLLMLAARANNAHDLAFVTCLQLTLYTALDRLDRGIEICLEYLRRGGLDWPAHPTGDDVQREYDRIWSLLGDRQIEDIVDGPLVTDPATIDILEVLTELITPAVFFDHNLCAVVIFRIVNLSLEHGNSDASCFAYVWFGMIAAPRFGRYADAVRFGQLGYDLLQKRGLKRYEARTCMCFGSVVVPSSKHARYSRDLLRHAFNVADRMGDFTYAAYSLTQLVTNFLVVGDPLAEVQMEAEKGIEFAKRARVGLVVDIIRSDLQLIRTLRGLTDEFGSFNDKQFDEAAFETHLASNPAFEEAGFGYWTLKAEARFFAGDYASAVDASSKAQQQVWVTLLEPAAFRFYSALSHAASWDSALPDKQKNHFEALTANHRQLKLWAEHCPDNFENRAALVGAEIARIEGRLVDAEGLYEKAIRSAHANGFIHNEAVAYEVAGRFYAARGFDKIADAYLQEARNCYLRWGADGKVRQLDELYPHLRKEKRTRGTSSMIVAPGELLDLATVIKVSQAVSGEMVLEKLIERIMRVSIEHAGAERGLLIRSLGDELQIEAEATITGKDVTVHLRDTSETAAMFPESVVRYVARAREYVILDDATAQNPFSADPYVVQHHARSIICLPLVNQGKLNGIIYLENNLSTHVFTADRITVLKVLASQAAISLENMRLYRDLENREKKIRRLVDANILGITIWNAEGAIVASNEAFLRMVQYDREDVASGRVRWRDMTPAEWRERTDRALTKVMQTGTVQPFESEMFRKDGTRVPVLLAGALFEDGGNEGVAFALDLSEQKRTEDALRRSENYLAEAQRLTLTGSCAIDGTSRETVYWSEEMFRIFGFDPQQGLPRFDQWLQRIHPDDRDKVKSASDRTFQQKVDCDVEFRIVKPDGTVKQIHGIGHSVLSPNGELLQVVGTMVDITEGRRAEEALRRSEAYLAEAQTLTHTGSFAWRIAGRDNVHMSEEWYRVFGFNPQDGMPPWEARFQRVHPQDRIKWQGAIDRAIQEKTDYDIKFRILLPDGTLKWIHTVGHPVLNGSGDLVQFVGTSTDITERKRAEEALRRSEAYLAESQRLTHTGSWASHATTHEALYWSEEMFRVFGFDPQQGLPMRDQWLQRIHPEDRDKVKRQASNRMFVQKVDADIEYRIVLPDGTVKHIHGLAHPVLGPNEELIEVVGTVVDITERKHAEEARDSLRQLGADLAHINRVSTMGELTASLAHEIKQPIGAAVTNAEACVRLLDRKQPDLPEAREAALEMVKDGRRAADIIDRVRLLYQKGSPRLEIVDINELVKEMVTVLHNEAKRHSVVIRADLSEGLPAVMADRVQLQQALMNLVLNGIEAMGDTGGELHIKSQLAEDGQLLISVTDAGVGLPTEKTDQIFNAFFTTKPHGTGLGLAITRSIVESHGGCIWATANSGPGTTFRFTLPQRRAMHA